MRTVTGGSDLGFGLAVKLRDDFTATSARVGASMTTLDKTASKTAAGVSGAMTKLSAGMALTGVGIAMVALPALAAASVAKVETHMGALRSVGIENTDAMYEAAFDAQNKWAGVTAESFADAAYDIKSGISTLTDFAVAEFTTMAATTAKATKSTVTTMTELFAKAYGIYKEQFVEMTDTQFMETFSAGLAASVKLFRTTGDAMSSAMTNLADSATALNVPMAEQLTILGQLQQTMGGQRAGVAYRAILKVLPKLGKELKITGEITNSVTGDFLPLADILDVVSKKTQGMGSAVRAEMLMSALGSEEAAFGFNSLIKKTDALRKSQTQLESAMGGGIGMVEEMAMMMNVGLSEQFKLLGQRFLTFFQRIGKIAAPLFAPILSSIGQLLVVVSDIVKTFPNATKVVVTLTVVFGALLTVTGLIVTGMALAQLATIHLGAAFVSTLIPKAILVATTLSSVLLPLMLLAGAGYLLYKAWKTDFAGLRTTVMKFITPIQTLWSFVSKAFMAMENGIATFTGAAAEEMFGLEKKLQEMGLYDFARVLITWLWRAKSFFKGFVTGMVDGASEIVKAITVILWPVIWVAKVIGRFTMGLAELFGILTRGDDTTGKVSYQFEKWGKVIGALASPLLVLAGIIASMKVVKMGVTFVTKGIDGLKKGLEIINLTRAAVPKMISGFKTGFTSIMGMPGGFAGVLRRQIAYPIRDLVKGVGPRFKTLGDHFKSAAGHISDFSKTAVTALKKFGSKLSSAGTAIMDFGREMIKGAKKVGIWAATMSVNAYKAVVKWIASLWASTTATTASTVATGSATVATGTLAASQTAAAGTSGGLSIALLGAAKAAWGFTVALLANPITWIIVGVVALGVAIYMLVKHWDTVTTAFVTAWNWVADVFTWIKDKVVDFATTTNKWVLYALAVFMPFIGIPLLIIKHWGTLKKWFGTFFGWIADTAVWCWNKVAGEASALWDTLKIVARGILDVLTFPFRAVSAIAKWTWELIKAGWEWLVGDSEAGAERFKQILIMPFTIVSTIAAKAWAMIKFGATKLWGALKIVARGILDVLTFPFRAVYEAAKWVWGKIKAGWDWLVGSSEAGSNTLTDYLLWPFHAVGDVLDWIWDKHKEIWNWISGLFSISGSSWKDILVAPFKFLLGFLTKTWRKIKSGISSVARYIGDKWDWVKTKAVGVWDVVADRGTSSWSKIKQAWSDSPGFFSGTWAVLKTGVSEYVTVVKDLWATFYEILPAPFKALVDVVKSTFGKVQDAIIGVISKIWDMLGSIITKMPDWLLPERLEAFKQTLLAAKAEAAIPLTAEVAANVVESVAAAPAVPSNVIEPTAPLAVVQPSIPVSAAASIPIDTAAEITVTAQSVVLPPKMEPVDYPAASMAVTPQFTDAALPNIVPSYSQAISPIEQGVVAEATGSLWGEPSSPESVLRPPDYYMPPADYPVSEMGVEQPAIAPDLGIDTSLSSLLTEALVQQKSLQQPVFGPPAPVAEKQRTAQEQPIHIVLEVDGKKMAQTVVKRMVDGRIRAYGSRS